MTNQDKIRGYYESFDEWGRLDTFPGQLELTIVLKLISAYIKPPATIFDLGGGAGRYTFELAKRGYLMHLADLSPDLIQIAKGKLSNFGGKDNVKSIGIANAVDLSSFQEETFENVLLFGPLYHLTTEQEIKKCLQEVGRVLQPKGKVFASFIPYHCGVMSILERSFRAPAQVKREVFSKVYETGVFNNSADYGFQEGNYLKSGTLANYFEEAGFQTLALRSIRGIGYTHEQEIIALENEHPEYYLEIMKVLEATAGDPPILETCGHAVYIGEKNTSFDNFKYSR